jgi:malate dehydrogenase (quinone)
MDARILEAPDIVLVGSGIMSATLAVMLKRLDPQLRIQMVEITSELVQEASNGWNNAGTGHAGICELSYTPARDPNGGVPITRALHIFEQFEHSKQFWGSATAEGMVGAAADFIHAVPHVCFVKGRDDVDFLRARHTAMVEHHFFRSMTFTTDSSMIQQWAPRPCRGHLRRWHRGGLRSVGSPSLRLAGGAGALWHRRRMEGDETPARRE